VNITKPVSIALGLALAITANLSPSQAAAPSSPFQRSGSTLTAQAGSVTKLSNSQAAAVLKRLGFEYQPSEKDPSNLVFSMDGYKIVLLNYSQSLQLYAGFNSNGKVSLETVNKWNKGKRFSRAYIDDENDAVIESDLDLEGGVSNEAIDEFIRTFRKSLRDFVKNSDL
jgi:hypothetical protein